MPVGPSAEEVERCRGTVASILRWEPAVQWIVLVDDSRQPRDLARQVGAGTVSLPHPLPSAARRDRVAVATLAGFGWVLRNTDAHLTMKIDTDALAIAAFADKLAAGTADPTVGMVGSYDVTCNGEPRSFQPWVELVKRTARLDQPTGIVISKRLRQVRDFIRDARAAGYQWGEHVLACSLAIPRRDLDSIGNGGGFDDPLTFVGTRLADDPILVLLVRRAGYRLAGHVGAGETFGVAWRGLPDTPERLAARGHSIIHSVKNDQRFSEREIRSHFAGGRGGGSRRASFVTQRR